MQFRGLELDKFQVDAVDALEAGRSVVVSAATGTGKTIIADYVIDKALKDGKRVFYTAPIKALSNQKFSQFKKIYGEDNVGILTGDISFNHEAPLVIMTTEIYRNMLLSKDPITKELAAVVFDEIHYLGDVDRGTVWEECIIFSPKHVRFVCLSATIPNARQFANWIESVQGHKVDVVTEKKRAVPLEHIFFDAWFGLSSLADMKGRKSKKQYPKYEELFSKKMHQRKSKYTQTHANPFSKHQQSESSHSHNKKEHLTHINLIQALQKTNRLSCIYFCFSRANTEKKSKELAQRMSFLTAEKKQEIDQLIVQKMQTTDPAVARLDTTKDLIFCLRRGIAFHHAGLLPILKELVEQSFELGFLSVLYATETFAVGINLPARTVCFDSLEKYDGSTFRYLRSTEYFQLAGRAGRRGLDKLGYSVSMVEPEFDDLDKIAHIITGETEPLISQYQLSYNTILNMIIHHTKEEREEILHASFYTYQQAGSHKERILAMYKKKIEKLQNMEYLEIIDNQDVLTPRGEFARHIYSNEIVLTELFTTEFAKEFSPLQIILLCAALEYEEKRGVSFKKGSHQATKELLDIFREDREIFTWFKECDADKLEPMLHTWITGGSFEQLTNLTTMPEGDIVRFMRRIIDVLQQLVHAVVITMPDNEELREKLLACIAAVDRGIVQVQL